MASLNDSLKGLVKKVEDALKIVTGSTKSLDTVRTEIDGTVRLIARLPEGSEKTGFYDTTKGWIAKIGDLKNRNDTNNTVLRGVWNQLKQALGLSGVSGLGVPPLVLIGIVSAALLGAAKLFKEVVNETRRISQENKKLEAVIQNKLPPEVLKETQVQKAGLFNFGNVSPLIMGAIALLILPALIPKRR